MRITRDHVPEAARNAPLRLTVTPVAWLALALLGVAIASGDGPWAGPCGAVLAALGAFRIGLLDRSPDPRLIVLSRELDRARAHVAALSDRDVRPAPAGDGGADGAPPAGPRPSAGVGGGGRPGAVDSAALRAAFPAPGDDPGGSLP